MPVFKIKTGKVGDGGGKTGAAATRGKRALGRRFADDPLVLAVLWRERPLAVAVNVACMLVQGLVPAAQLLVTQRLLDVVAAVALGGGEWP